MWSERRWDPCTDRTSRSWTLFFCFTTRKSDRSVEVSVCDGRTEVDGFRDDFIPSHSLGEGDQYHQYDHGIVTTSRGRYVADPAAGSPPQLQDVPDRPRTQKPLFLLCRETPGMSLGSCIVTQNGVTGHCAGDLGVIWVHGQRIRDSRQCVYHSTIPTCRMEMVLMRLREHLLTEQ